MTMHILSQIDLEHKTAFCTACGYTEIHVPKNYDPARSKLACVQRHKQRNLAKKMWGSLSPEERKLVRKERHSLTEIDPALRRATCVICGPTDIHQYSHNGRKIYRCATLNRLSNRSADLRDFMPPSCERVLLVEIYKKKKAAKGLLSWTDLWQINLGDLSGVNRPKPRVIHLQEASEKKKQRAEEKTRLVHEYKRTHSCKRCGARSQVPQGLRFFEAHLPSGMKIRRLMPKLDPEQLVLELEKRDLYCPTCYERVLTEYHRKSPAPPGPDR